MIAPFEFRIGNLYIHRYGDGEVTECNRVTAQLLKYMESQDEEIWQRRYWPEPIPLTEAVLMAAGFEWDDRNIRYKTNKNTFFEISFSEEQGVTINYSVCRQRVNVNSLHQLQNLYHIINGKELEINIEKLKEAVK